MDDRRGHNSRPRSAETPEEMIDFDPTTHTYTFGGRRVPSVTQCIDRLNDYSMVPADLLERKRELGTAVHQATALYDQDDLDWGSVADEVYPYLEGWIKFRDDTGFVPSGIELRVFSKKRLCAGTLDRTGEADNLPDVKPDEEVLLDIKATAEMMPAVGPQTAGYEELHWNNGQRKRVKHRRCVLLKPDGTYRLEKLEDAYDKTVFLACLTLAKWEALHA